MCVRLRECESLKTPADSLFFSRMHSLLRVKRKETVACSVAAVCRRCALRHEISFAILLPVSVQSSHCRILFVFFFSHKAKPKNPLDLFSSIFVSIIINRITSAIYLFASLLRFVWFFVRRNRNVFIPLKGYKYHVSVTCSVPLHHLRKKSIKRVLYIVYLGTFFSSSHSYFLFSVSCHSFVPTCFYFYPRATEAISSKNDM